MQRRVVWLVGFAGIAGLAGIVALSALPACGDGFSVTNNPEIEIQANDAPIADLESATVSFGQALQASVDVDVRISNPGDAPLTIDGIDWLADDATGGVVKNPYVELVGLDTFTFPLTLEPKIDRVRFKVRYTPPLGRPLDDYSPSELLIRSNATDKTGKISLSDLVVRFTMPQLRAMPTLTPNKYTFQNATVAKPERQTFRIGNDEDLGTASFTVTDIRLDQASNVFILDNLPNLPANVLAPGEPAYAEVTFDVVYAPSPSGGGQTSNMVIVDTDQGQLTAKLTTGYLPGNYSLSFSHVDKFDFSAVNTVESRRVVLMSDGPGPITVKQPAISPDGAKSTFSWTAYVPATAPGQAETELPPPWTSPRGLQAGRSLEFEITYAPGADPSQSENGLFEIPIATPDNGVITLNLFAGTPKPLFDLAPANKAILVSADRSANAAGDRQVVIYNDGNGDMVVKSVALQGSFGQDAEVFSLVSPPAADTIIPPGGTLPVALHWDSTKIPDGLSDATESMQITYVHGVASVGEVTEPVSLNVFDVGPTPLPVANPGVAADYPDIKVGDAVSLDGSASSAGEGGEFQGSSFCYWYLVSKPDGARAALNAEGGFYTELRPDAPGTWVVEMLVYAQNGGDYIYSEPAQLTLSVAPAQ